MDLWGREQQLGQVLARLASRRLVTVTGPGGIGKTALAEAAQERAAADFELGGTRVDLTVVDAPALVPGTIAAQLGYSTFEALVGSRTEQPVLLLVDNCEHVLTAAADAIGKLLAACRAPTVLATSRSPFGAYRGVPDRVGPAPGAQRRRHRQRSPPGRCGCGRDAVA